LFNKTILKKPKKWKKSKQIRVVRDKLIYWLLLVSPLLKKGTDVYSIEKNGFGRNVHNWEKCANFMLASAQYQ
jgi:hypothetical protein